MAKEGIPFIVLFLAPAVVLALVGIWIGSIICLILTGFMAFFFRDPSRRPPVGEDIIVAPADGRVVVVSRMDPADEQSPIQVSIFLSPMDVHINRSPIDGTVVEVAYKRGKFHVASRDIASVENEQNVIILQGQHVRLIVRQIAGILARRVVLWVGPGDHVKVGERIGLMKFSSRMDVVIPPEVEVLARPGQRVVGGVTVIGRVKHG
jgi:phosphatidylserine decarboxylase